MDDIDILIANTPGLRPSNRKMLERLDRPLKPSTKSEIPPDVVPSWIGEKK